MLTVKLFVTFTCRSVKSKVESGDAVFEEVTLQRPHDVIVGVNHAQFCTGELTDTVLRYWIEPEVSDDESRRLLAGSVSPYIVCHTSVSQDC